MRLERRPEQRVVPRPAVLGVRSRVDADIAVPRPDVALERPLLCRVQHITRRAQEHHHGETREVRVGERRPVLRCLDGEIIVGGKLVNGGDPVEDRGVVVARRAGEDEHLERRMRRQGGAWGAPGVGHPSGAPRSLDLQPSTAARDTSAIHGFRTEPRGSSLPLLPCVIPILLALERYHQPCTIVAGCAMPIHLYALLTWTTERRLHSSNPHCCVSAPHAPAIAARHNTRVVAHVVGNHVHMIVELPSRIDIPRLLQGLKGADAHIANRDKIMRRRPAAVGGWIRFAIRGHSRSQAGNSLRPHAIAETSGARAGGVGDRVGSPG